MIVLMAATWALIGFVAAAVIGTEIGPAFGFRNMEGSSAIFGVMLVAPMGAIGGLVLGIWLARRFAGDERKLGIAAGGPWAVAALVMLAAVVANEMSREPERRNIAMFAVQVRLPPGTPAPASSDVLIELRHDKPDQTIKGFFYPDFIKSMQGEPVVLEGLIDTWVRTTNRTIAVRIGNGPTHLFRLNLPASPSDSNFSGWQPADNIEQPNAPPRASKPGEGVEIRHRAEVRY